MPSGAKKRRAAKRKMQEGPQANQTDELTTVSIVKLTIPIEELAKGAVLHEAASVDKELQGGEVCESNVATVDENATEEEVSLDIVVSKVESLVSQNAGCIIESVESGENMKEIESCVVECSDSKEADGNSMSLAELLLRGVDEEVLRIADLIAELPSDSGEAENTSKFPKQSVVHSEEMIDTSQLSSGENKQFILPCLDLPVVTEQLSSTEGKVVSDDRELEEANQPIGIVTDKFKVATLDENAVEENQGLELPVVIALPSSNEDLKENAPSAEIAFNFHETQAVSTITASPATENQPSNPECTDIKEFLEVLMARVVEFESSIRSFKEALQNTLDKHNAISY